VWYYALGFLVIGMNKGKNIMSNTELCRECEHNSVDDTVLCHDCAEFGFIDLMRTKASKRWEVFIGDYYYSNLAEFDSHSDAVFEAWVEGNPEKAGKLLFKLFDKGLEEYQFDGEL